MSSAHKAPDSTGVRPRRIDLTVRRDPTTAALEDGVEVVRVRAADSIIGFGGGSPMGSAKARAVLATQGGPMRNFKAPSSYAGPALPVIDYEPTVKLASSMPSRGASSGRMLKQSIL